MRTNFFCTNFLNTVRGPGHPGKNPWDIPDSSLRNPRKTNELFGHHPFAWKTPTPPGGLRTQKVNLCALFSCLIPGIDPPWRQQRSTYNCLADAEALMQISSYGILCWNKRNIYPSRTLLGTHTRRVTVEKPRSRSTEKLRSPGDS